jgi:hypothetical protein
MYNMKNVAFCMRGAVSTYKDNNLFNNIGNFKQAEDLYKNKNYINLKVVKNSILKHIIQCNPN